MTKLRKIRSLKMILKFENSKLKIENSRIEDSRSGFTLIEMLVVVAITAVFGTMGFVFLGSYRGSQDLKKSLDQMLASVQSTQKRSITQDNGSQWGVRFSNTTSSGSQYLTFSGASFSTSTVDRMYGLANGMKFSEPALGFTYDALFAPITGVLPAKKIISMIDGRGDGLVGDLILTTTGRATKRNENGLVGYWHFDEATSTVVYDASGSGNNGALISSPVWQNGSNCMAGDCLSFNGVSSYAKIDNSVSLNPTNLTVSVWAKSNTSTWNDYGFLASKRNAYIIHPTLGTTSVSFYIYTTNWTSVSCGASNITNWNLYTFTWNGTTLSCYINGIIGASGMPGGSINTTDTGELDIGKDDGIARYFNGSIDEVRIYNRALSASEILSQYNDLK